MSWVDSEQLRLIKVQLNQIERKLNAILRNQGIIYEGEQAMSAQLDALESAVHNATAIEESAVVLIQGLIEELKNAKDDPAKIEALTAELSAKTDALAAAITANTPSEPAPVVDPTPATEETATDTTASE